MSHSMVKIDNMQELTATVFDGINGNKILKGLDQVAAHNCQWQGGWN